MTIEQRPSDAHLAVAELRARTLVGVVQEELERRILDGRIAPGERLNEQVLADELSVSRGPVREACRALAETGLVQLIPNRGAFVKTLTREDAIDVYDLRAGLLGLAASLLAARLTKPTAGVLERCIGDMDAAARREDAAGFSRFNTEFHDCMVSAAGNARLTKLYRGLVKEFQLFRSHAPSRSANLLKSNQEHREIVRALKAGDASASWRLTSGHVESGKQRMLAALEGGPAPATTPRGRSRAPRDPR